MQKCNVNDKICNKKQQSCWLGHDDMTSSALSAPVADLIGNLGLDEDRARYLVQVAQFTRSSAWRGHENLSDIHSQDADIREAAIDRMWRDLWAAQGKQAGLPELLASIEQKLDRMRSDYEDRLDWYRRSKRLPEQFPGFPIPEPDGSQPVPALEPKPRDPLRTARRDEIARELIAEMEALRVAA